MRNAAPKSECDIAVAYATSMCFRHPSHLFTYFPFLDTQIRRLISEFYHPGLKNLDSVVRVTPITTCSNPFCCKSHMWNHARTFTCFTGEI